MNAALREQLAERLAESRTEWRPLADDAALADFLAEAGCADAAPVLLCEDGRGFTLVDALLADTGTLVLTNRLPGARRCAFLADSHYALCAEENVLATLADFFAAHAERWRERCGDALTLITGPSRTADIEKVLVLGAHGPRRLVLGSAPAHLIAARFGAAAPEAPR